MQRIYRFFLGWIKSAVESLAFLPLPMMIGGFVLGFGLFYLELNTEVSAEIRDSMPAVMVSSQETARTILGILIGGLITLTVFTFTQMMSLFSQVAGSYSPRLLPYLTGSRSLQFVMGTYLSVIVLSLIVLLSIRGDDEGFVPNLSVLFCIILGVLCLMLFLYFVTTISNKIQVDNIIESVYRRGLEAIKREQDNDSFAEKTLPQDLEDWYAIPSPIGGFIGTVNHQHLSEIAKREGTRFYIGSAKGQFLPKNAPLLKSDKKLSAEAIKEVLEAVSPIHRKYNDWHLPPIRLLTEIAVKAMSPGINDPGTAIDVLDRMTGLLARLMNLPEYNYYCPQEDGGEVWLTNYRFGEVITGLMQALRQYSKADTLVVRRLFQMLFHLAGSAGDSPTYQRLIHVEIEALLEDARANITNSKDRSVIAREIMIARNGLKQLFEDTDFLLDAHLLEVGTKD